MKPNSSVAVTADRNVELPPGDQNQVIVSATSTQTLTNKTLTSPAVTTPTGIVKGDVGLANVDNTSDVNKPVSTAQATADGVVQAFAIQRANHTGTQAVGTITGLATVATSGLKADVGLGNVDNTSDATKNSAAATLLNKATISSTSLATGALSLPSGTTAERPGTPANALIRYNTTLSSFEGYQAGAWSAVGGGSSGVLDVAQAAHGFSVGDAAYLNGATYAKAKADASNTAEVIGVVSTVTDANNFKLTNYGSISGLSGLTAGTTYFLSAATAGLLTATEPSTIGNVSVPVLVASSATTGFVNIMRGMVVGGTNALTSIAVANNATTTIQNVSAYQAGELTGYVSVAGTASQKLYIAAQFSKNAAGTDYNLSYQTSGETPVSGFSMSVTTGGLIQITLPSVTGFTAASITYGLNVPAVGASFPLSIQASKVAGAIDGAAVATGYIGQVIASAVTTLTNMGTNLEYFDATSITLTAGVWRIDASFQFSKSGATAALHNPIIGISTTSGNSATGLITGVNAVEFDSIYATAGGAYGMCTPSIVVRNDVTTITRLDDATAFASGQILYLKCFRSNYSAATPQYKCKLIAVRIA